MDLEEEGMTISTEAMAGEAGLSDSEPLRSSSLQLRKIVWPLMWLRGHILCAFCFGHIIPPPPSANLDAIDDAKLSFHGLISVVLPHI